MFWLGLLIGFAAVVGGRWAIAHVLGPNLDWNESDDWFDETEHEFGHLEDAYDD